MINDYKQLSHTEDGRFRRLIESIPIGYFRIECTRAGRFLDVNHRLVSMLSYKGRKELLEADLHSLFTDIHERERFYQQVDSIGVLTEEEIHLRRKDGRPFRASLSAWIIRSESDQTPSLEGLIEDITERHRIEEMAIRVETLRKAIQGATTALSAVTESRDPMTAEHQNRVARLAVAIAREMHLPADRIEAVRVSALLHDIGKIYIPLAVLNRSDRLEELEFGMVEAHPEVGYSILKSVERETEPFPWPIAEIIYQHHERIDGSGYPQGLKGDAILLEARILAIADVVSAMLSPRPYRPPIPISEVLEEIERHLGIQFDERAARACLSLFRDGGFTFESVM